MKNVQSKYFSRNWFKDLLKCCFDILAVFLSNATDGFKVPELTVKELYKNLSMPQEGIE